MTQATDKKQAPKRQPAKQRPSAGKRQKAAKRPRSLARPILCAAILLALMGGSFGLGWFFGVKSTHFKGKILLVNESHRLAQDYEPEGLVNLYEQRHSFRLARSDIYLTRETYLAAERMFAAAEADGVNGFTITSGYRSYHRQEEVFAESEPGKAQQPGASEHQTGLAFDVTAASSSGDFETTEQYGWLTLHAHEYGFIQRYPANKAEETGISYEPWHYRYVGVEAATAMHETGETLEAFLQRNR